MCVYLMSFSNARAKIWFVMLFGLCVKETSRIFRIFNQTIIAPCVESLIVLIVIGIAIKNDVSLSEFLSSGFLVGGVAGSLVIKNAFANSSSVLVISKMTGCFNDYLMPPFAKSHIFLSVVFGSCIRGVLGFFVFLLATHVLVAKISISHWPLLIFVCFTVAVLFGALGLIAGLLVDGFEKMSMVSSYIIAPLSMFSGSFFGIDRFPPYIQKIFLVNPFFYSIDVVKYCVTGASYANIGFELAVLCCCAGLSVLAAFVVLSLALRTDKS